MMFGLSPVVWEVIGFTGQALFTARFLVQWLASEKKKESVVPVSFWWLSLIGSSVLAIYAGALRDPVFLLGSLINGFLYLRNLILIHLHREKPTSKRILVPATLAICAFLLVAAFGKLDKSIPTPWLVIGFVGAACWSGRFVIQWFASERAGKSVLPRSFWYVGLAGAIFLLAYSVYRKTPVFILGYLFPPFPYIRNLVLIYRKEGMPAPIRWADGVWRNRRSRAVVIVVFSVALAALLAGRVLKSKHPAGDFLRYHRAGHIVATGNAAKLYKDGDEFYHAYAESWPELAERERRFRYLPTFAVLMAPLGMLPPRLAEVLWAWHNAFCFLMTLAICRWFTTRYGVRAAWMWVPVLFTLRFGWDNINLGQINPTMILCATAGLYLVETRRPLSGGLITALGAAVKFTPVILLVVYAVRGRWKAVGAMLAGVVLLVAVLPGVVLGPGMAHDLVEELWNQQGTALLTETQQLDVTGESLRAITYRVLGDLPLRKQGRVLDVSLGLLDEDGSLLAYRLLAVLLFLWLCWFAATRRRDLQAPLVGGAAFCAMLLISPETRQPHFLILALPVTALVMVAVRAGFKPLGSKVIVAILALAFVLSAIPSRSIVGKEAMFLFVAWCASGFSAIFVLAGQWIGSGLVRDEA